MNKSTVFISYSHNDEPWKILLRPHLAILEKTDQLVLWDDRQIDVGDECYEHLRETMGCAAVAKFASLIVGLPDHPIEDVKLSNIRILYGGGGTKEAAAIEPPGRENNYPEPSKFGTIPAYGFYVRHVKGLERRDVEVSLMTDDARPAFVRDDVNGADLRGIKAQRNGDAPTFVLKKVEDYSVL